MKALFYFLFLLPFVPFFFRQNQFSKCFVKSLLWIILQNSQKSTCDGVFLGRSLNLNPFYATDLFLYPLKPKVYFSDICRGYVKRTGMKLVIKFANFYKRIFQNSYSIEHLWMAAFSFRNIFSLNPLNASVALI